MVGLGRFCSYTRFKLGLCNQAAVLDLGESHGLGDHWRINTFFLRQFLTFNLSWEANRPTKASRGAVREGGSHGSTVSAGCGDFRVRLAACASMPRASVLSFVRSGEHGIVWPRRPESLDWGRTTRLKDYAPALSLYFIPFRYELDSRYRPPTMDRQLCFVASVASRRGATAFLICQAARLTAHL